MAETKKPEDVLASLLSNGNAPNPMAQLDTSAWMPTYARSPQEEAQSRADLEYGSQIRAQQEAAQQAAASNQRSQTIEQNYGREIDPRLAEIYKALGQSMTDRRGETQQSYNQAVGNIQGYYNQAQQQNQSTNTDMLNRIAQMSQNLGVGAAVPDAIQKLMGNYQFEQQALSKAGAGRASNLQQLATQIFGLDTQRIGAAAQEGAQARATAQNQVLKTLSDLVFQNEQEQSGFRRQIAGLEGDKGKALAQLLAEITDQRSQDSISARNNALQEMIQRSGIAQQNRQFEEQQRQFNEQMRQAEMDRAASAAAARSRGGGGGGGGGGNPLNDMYKMLQIESLQQKLGTKNLKGQEALEAFWGTPNQYWTKGNPVIFGSSAGPKFRSAISTVINEAIKRANPQGGNKGNVFTPQPKRDPYAIAMNLMKQNFGGMNMDAARAALDAYFKGYTVRP